MRSFLGFGQYAYIGKPQAQAIKIGGIAGQTVPLLFQWLAYGASSGRPNINVLVDLRVSACVKLDQIRSVYIDNLGSDNPVYVYFPDTQYTVAAKPNSEGWYPAFTNDRLFWVIGENFITGDIPQSLVQVSNIPFQPSVNVEQETSVSLWKASATGSAGFISNVSGPAIGDQLDSAFNMIVAVPGVIKNGLWRTPYPSGFLYVQSFYLYAYDFPAAGGQAQITIESTGLAGTLFEVYIDQQNSTVVNNDNLVLIDFRGANLKLDATQLWRIRVSSVAGLVSGLATLQSIFTTNPT